jgi:hypothetical protein
LSVQVPECLQQLTLLLLSLVGLQVEQLDLLILWKYLPRHALQVALHEGAAGQHSLGQQGNQGKEQGHKS